MTKLRVDRVAQAQLVHEASTKDWKAGKQRPGSETSRLNTEVAALDEEIRKARLAIAAERAKFAPIFLEQVGPHAVATEQVINTLITLLDDAVKPALDAHNFAEANTLPSPRLVSHAQHLHAAVHQFRRLMAGSW